MTTGNLTWEQAVLRVLEEAGEPMHYRDVADIIVQQNLTRSVGATPPNQANYALRSLVRSSEVAEAEGVGMYALPAVAKRAAEEDARFEGIASYGLYWEKNRVNWNPGQRGRGVRGIKLLGRAKGEDKEVNFASQQGIYLLHQGMDFCTSGRRPTPTTDCFCGCEATVMTLPNPRFGTGSRGSDSVQCKTES